MTTVTKPFAGYASWLAQNPAPDLQAFITKHGGSYRRIPPELWNEWDWQVAQWQSRRQFWPWEKMPEKN